MRTLLISTLTLSACAAISGFSIAQPSTAHSQSETQKSVVQNSAQQGATATAAKAPAVIKKVGFRMTAWRTVHGDGTQATTDLIATLQKIGCEVRQNDHGGHTDISFQCPSWKTVSVQNDDQSHQWHQWFVDNEFETVVLNPPTSTKLPTVLVRMENWKTIHAQSAQQAQTLKATYELIGCEAVVENHGDHIDLKFRCPNWSTVALVNSQAAHVWQDWLDKSGFETQHDHSADGHDAHAEHNHGTANHEGHNHSKDNHEDHNHEGHSHK